MSPRWEQVWHLQGLERSPRTGMEEVGGLGGDMVTSGNLGVIYVGTRKAVAKRILLLGVRCQGPQESGKPQDHTTAAFTDLTALDSSFCPPPIPPLADTMWKPPFPC